MDKALKQRLTGAVILIALAIIFLPMLLDGENQNPSESRLELPEKPVVNFPTRRIPIGQHKTASEQIPGSSTVSMPTTIAGPPASLPTAEETELGDTRAAIGQGMVITPLNTDRSDNPVIDNNSGPIQSPVENSEVTDPDSNLDLNDSITTAPQVAAAVEKTEKPPMQTGQWKLQIASFAGRSNAEKLVSRLRRTGYQANIETIKTEKESLYRVLVPAYPDRSAATLAAASISKQIAGVNPKVIPPQSDKDDLKPVESVSVTRWVVQLGIFSQATNADKLVAELILQNYPASRVASGKVHKVLVGPLLSREIAMRERDEIFKKIHIKGLVKEAH